MVGQLILLVGEFRDMSLTWKIILKVPWVYKMNSKDKVNWKFLDVYYTYQMAIIWSMQDSKNKFRIYII